MEAEVVLHPASRPWLGHYPRLVAPYREYPDIPIQELLQRSAAVFPDRIALHFLGYELNYAELWRKVTILAANLKKLGLVPGDRVGIMLPNCPQAVIAYYGVLQAGGVVVFTNPLYVERELRYQMRDSGAKFLIALDILYRRVMEGVKETPVEKIFFTAIEEFLPRFKGLLFALKKRKDGQHIPIPYQAGRVLPFGELLRGRADGAAGEVNGTRKGDDLAMLQYTGGTTGIPKGVMLSHQNVVVNTMQTADWFYTCRRGKEQVLCVLPFFHVYGMTTAMNHGIYIGGTLVLIPRFDVKLILKTIQRQEITFFPGAPTMYVGVIHHPDAVKYDLSSIKACISGAAPMPVEVLQEFEEQTGSWLVEGYGLSEASPVTHCNPLERRKVGSIGIPLANTDCRIVDPETRADLGPGVVGELAVRGPQVMLGYWNKPEETAKTLDHEGWLYTGDLARMDEEGYFYIVDRKKDLIIAGGYNIYPREVEEVLYEHPQVMEAVVIGVPDPYRGETVKAFIVLKEGEIGDEKEIMDFCRTRLAPYKAPKIIEFRKELPKTLSGKILRRMLKEEEKEQNKTNNAD